MNQTENKYGGSTQTKINLSEQSKSDTEDGNVYFKANDSFADKENATQSSHESSCFKLSVL